MAVGALGKARKRKAGGLWLRAPWAGFPPASSFWARWGLLSPAFLPRPGGVRRGVPPPQKRKVGKRPEGTASLHISAGTTGQSPVPCREGGLDSGPRLPRQCSAPAAALGGAGLPGVPPRPPAAHQGAGTSRLPRGVPAAGSAGLQRLRAAWGLCSHPGQRPLPAGSPGSPAPPASLPVTPRAALPREGPGGRLASGRSDRLGSPSWPARLSHSAGPTPARPPRTMKGLRKLQPGLVKSLLRAPAGPALLKGL